VADLADECEEVVIGDVELGSALAKRAHDAWRAQIAERGVTRSSHTRFLVTFSSTNI
jgi:hypothetical protein